MTTFEVVAEGLGKRYGPTRALDTFDLTVPPGTVHGLLGPNGAGKTTAVRILTTLLAPTTGRSTREGPPWPGTTCCASRRRCAPGSG